MRLLEIALFAENKRSKIGLLSRCRDCTRAVGREYAARNKEAAALRAKEWAGKNKEHLRRKRREDYLANKDKVATQSKAWVKANPERVKEYRRRNEAKRRGKRPRAKTDSEKNRLRLNAYYKANPDKIKALVHAYRARKRGALGSYTPEDIDRIFRLQRGLCAYCRTDVTGRRVIDHIHPLSKGGTNFPRNLQIVCLSCNSSKRDKDPITFAQQLGLLL